MKKMFRVLTLVFFILLYVNVQHSGVGKKNRGTFYVIGTGPAGPQLATLQALETIKQMDMLAAPSELLELFDDYTGNKPVLFDPLKGLYDYKGKFFRQLSGEEMIDFKKERLRLRKERVELIKSRLDKGQNIGLLDSGNPCLFAPGQWYAEQFDPQDLVIIPGMGSDAAAMAALAKSVIPAFDTRFVIQTSPVYLINRQNMSDLQMLKDISEYPNTMILYMAVGMPERLFSILAKIYPPDMPCAVVYWAGFPDRQRIIRGTITDMGQKLLKEEEKYMGLLLIGRFLEGKPYDAAVK
ncbi:MAG: SAM-dependent methyltransferase [Candidatus Aminicenantes bacterium]|jgi:precorrin-4 methylase